MWMKGELMVRMMQDPPLSPEAGAAGLNTEITSDSLWGIAGLIESIEMRVFGFGPSILNPVVAPFEMARDDDDEDEEEFEDDDDDWDDEDDDDLDDDLEEEDDFDDDDDDEEDEEED